MLDLVTSYPWPGNVRELQNVIERAVIVCETDTLVVDENWLSQDARAPTRPLGIALLTHEREMIEAALAGSRQGRRTIGCRRKARFTTFHLGVEDPSLEDPEVPCAPALLTSDQLATRRRIAQA